MSPSPLFLSGTKKKFRLTAEKDRCSRKYPNMQWGKMEAVINKLGGEDGVDRFLRDELVVSVPVRSWREEDGVIYFTVTSNGKSGKEWIKHFESRKIKISDYAKQLLLSKDFKPSKKGTVSQIALIKGESFSDDDRITSKIRREADRHKMEKSNAEVACLIRDLFTDEEIKAMGLYWIITMHEPIKDSDGAPRLLSMNRDGGGPWFDTYYDRSGFGWGRESGFAFVAPQV
ncbi:MAG: hypothetical protein WCX27_00070 [Candidatus Paceibacterota bacterium]